MASPVQERSAMMRLLLVVLFAWAGVVACGAPRPVLGCHSREGLRCLTPVVCEVDRALGCEVCRCADAPYTPVSGGPATPR